jgi:hypothetical protein
MRVTEISWQGKTNASMMRLYHLYHDWDDPSVELNRGTELVAKALLGPAKLCTTQWSRL